MSLKSKITVQLRDVDSRRWEDSARLRRSVYESEESTQEVEKR